MEEIPSVGEPGLETCGEVGAVREDPSKVMLLSGPSTGLPEGVHCAAPEFLPDDLDCRGNGKAGCE